MLNQVNMDTQDEPHTVTPSLGELSNQTVIILNLHNVVKILALYRKLHDALQNHPGDETLRNRLEVVSRWVSNVLQQYEELSRESRLVVDMFVENWGSKGISIAHLKFCNWLTTLTSQLTRITECMASSGSHVLLLNLAFSCNFYYLIHYYYQSVMLYSNLVLTFTFQSTASGLMSL